jgi:hypothetical protein
MEWKAKEEKCINNTRQVLSSQLKVPFTIYNTKEDKSLYRFKQCCVIICLICGDIEYLNTNPVQQNDFFKKICRVYAEQKNNLLMQLTSFSDKNEEEKNCI